MTDLNSEVGAEEIAFLRQQFANAVERVRSLEEGQVQQYNLFEARIAERFRVRIEAYEKEKKRMRATIDDMRPFALRYAVLREEVVQVWKFGIAAKGEVLDRMLDEKVKRIVAQGNQPSKQPSGDLNV